MIETRERPILMCGDMVCATLADIKSQTRRLIKFPLTRCGTLNPCWSQCRIPKWYSDAGGQGSVWFDMADPVGTAPTIIESPYGYKGDRLWVRETWRIGAWSHERQAVAVDYRANDFARREWLQVPSQDAFSRYVAQSLADCTKAAFVPDSDVRYHWEPGFAPTRWRPSIHMPRWASRITLEITDVRVERLQEIKESDARAEGMQIVREEHGGRVVNRDTRTSREPTLIETFAHLWDQLNAKRGYPWASNPWVWVVAFRRLEGEQ